MSPDRYPPPGGALTREQQILDARADGQASGFGWGLVCGWLSLAVLASFESAIAALIRAAAP